MESPAPKIEVETWTEPAAPAPAWQAPRLDARWRRALTGVAALAIHVLVLVSLASRQSLPEGKQAAPPFVTTMTLESEPMPAAAEIRSFEPELNALNERRIGVMTPPALPEDALDMSFEKPEEPVVRDFQPPRLEAGSLPDTAEFARRAGVAPGKSARVILAVTVTERGTAGDILVTVGSGNSRADALAVEYARALRWSPAVVQGRNSSMKIRLPVVLAMPS